VERCNDDLHFADVSTLLCAENKKIAMQSAEDGACIEN